MNSFPAILVLVLYFAANLVRPKLQRVHNLTVKKGKDLVLIEQLSKPKLPENIVLYCVVQTDQEQLTIICKHALDCTNKDNLISLVFFREIDQLLNSFNESISNSRSGHSFDNFNSLFLP